MPITLLSNETIDKIAAGEVVEKPINVVKELVENSIDAGSTAISIEIKGGGTELIRVTDNGCGIEKSECPKAFLRHATSKITSIEDLMRLSSLGFRGEALSSVSAVSKTEMITKKSDTLLGTHVVVEGGKLMECSEIGAPDGTTIIVRSLFYNTPARKKFLKSDQSEGAAIEDMVEKIALSNPGISFSLTLNGKLRISTNGNNDLKDVVYHLFGKDVYNSLIPVEYCENDIHITGYAASPDLSYQARNGELYFVNGRYVKSRIINTAIEEAYKGFLMKHRFPFSVLNINVPTDSIDVNVHPQKLDVKFSDGILISDSVINALNNALTKKEFIPEVTVSLPEEKPKPVETVLKPKPVIEEKHSIEPFEITRRQEETFKPVQIPVKEEYKQETLFEKKLISDEPIKRYRIIGEVFDTYWLLTLDDDLYIVDQHAAHEKVNYEKMFKDYNENTEVYGQIMSPPLVIHLSAFEEEALKKYIDVFNKVGFEIEEFGIGSYAVRMVPENLYGLKEEDFFHRLLNELLEKDGVFSPSIVCEKLASMSCKAAIKGGMRITFTEMEHLMQKLMKLDNPYNCPHGRPVFIKIAKTELEKKFKRIV